LEWKNEDQEDMEIQTGTLVMPIRINLSVFKNKARMRISQSDFCFFTEQGWFCSTHDLIDNLIGTKILNSIDKISFIPNFLF